MPSVPLFVILPRAWHQGPHLLDVMQRLYDSDVVQVDPPCCVPVLDGCAMFRDRQALQKLLQVVVVVINDAVYRKTKDEMNESEEGKLKPFNKCQGLLSFPHQKPLHCNVLSGCQYLRQGAGWAVDGTGSSTWPGTGVGPLVACCHHGGPEWPWPRGSTVLGSAAALSGIAPCRPTHLCLPGGSGGSACPSPLSLSDWKQRGTGVKECISAATCRKTHNCNNDKKCPKVKLDIPVIRDVQQDEDGEVPEPRTL